MDKNNNMLYSVFTSYIMLDRFVQTENGCYINFNNFQITYLHIRVYRRTNICMPCPFFLQFSGYLRSTYDAFEKRNRPPQISSLINIFLIE